MKNNKTIWSISGSRRCYKCNQYKSPEMFCKDKTTTDGLRRSCRECSSKYILKRSRSNRDYIWDLKRLSHCADCGGNFHPAAMDFDPTEKVANVGNMMNNSKVVRELEISKCEIVCANCHRVRTYNRRKDKNESKTK